ncbi:eukaryotic translation elongation factor 1 epsilon-1 isoform X1 [Cephus cinctus]|uniref:Eukaryotic translation elongation factor 1 epsilon-1 isoform X1 n=1 Tax=Cephus cinctus TaxID=211228 RepID=A0AAJ7BYW9_CEPCN|nr:eukaryotic translation elongation factor 1 epsilon-1 isoform X1 [Cephus cinctus]
MVLCNVKCVENISKYLNVAPGKLYVSKNNVVAAKDLLEKESLEGFSTIVQTLVKLSKFSNILGKDAVTQALTRQWLEYVVLNVNYADNLKNVKRILKVFQFRLDNPNQNVINMSFTLYSQELNLILRKSTYITGTEKTVADVVLYYALHSIMQGLTHQEKAEYVNVSRWFDNIQQDEKLRQELELINFNLLNLYL